MILLGSTGSIGVNALSISKQFNLNIDVLVAGKSIELLNQQIQEFSPRVVVIADKQDVSRVKHSKVLHGEEGILEAIQSSESSLVINSLVGFFGPPSPRINVLMYLSESVSLPPCSLLSIFSLFLW